MKELQLIIITLLVAACSQQKETQIQEYVFNKDFAIENKVTDLFSDVTYTPLETTDDNLIGFNPQLYVSPSGIFIFDQQHTKRVLRFNNSGGFENFVGNIGDGPEEYKMPTAFFVNQPAKEIIISAAPSGMLYHYEQDGTFRKKECLDKSIVSFTLGNNNKYWIYTGGNVVSDKDRLLLINGTQKEQGFLPVISQRAPSNQQCFSNSPICAFQESFNDSIYHISGDRLHLKYKLNFGSLQIPQSVRDGANENFGKYLSQNPYIAVFRFLENNNFIYAGLVENAGVELKGLYHWIIDKRSDKQSLVKMDMDNALFMGLQYPLQLTENDELIFLMNSPFFDGINKKENTVFYKENQNQTISENPVLTVCKLKQL